MNKSNLLLFILLNIFSVCVAQKVRVYDVDDYNIRVDKKGSVSEDVVKLIDKIKNEYKEGDSIVIRFHEGIYNFHEKGAASRFYYISNHDQNNPKKVGLPFEGFKRMTVEGNGARFVFHGRMLPLSLLNSENCTLKDFSIDFVEPHITQIKVVASDSQKGLTFEPASWVNYRITKDSIFEVYGKNWTLTPQWGVAFEPNTKRLIYNAGDMGCPVQGVYKIGKNRLQAPNWKDNRLVPGTIFAMRGWGRPVPGIFLSQNLNTSLLRIKVHYAEGMGLLAQLCENITLDGFSVCLKGMNDPRYFTTQADATHFSGCKGKIISKNGLYEGMMDDAINVHGTYLKVVKRIDNYTLVGRYMHDQSWGFEWGKVADKVQFIASRTMEIVGDTNIITSISPYDREEIDGTREFKITFSNIIPDSVNEGGTFGIENLTWSPEVEFSHNIIRNNRARGALFSTPRRVVIEKNLFDHTSGSAILLCGDCNGWYETGACREVIIRHNKFINALTSMYQFTNAVISIYPEIPDLDGQHQYFHGGRKESIIIEENEFDMFDVPLLYAKSVDGLVFRNNLIRKNSEYKPFHFNQNRFWLERVTNFFIE